MKNIIICDLFGTLLKIDHQKIPISPWLQEKLLTKCDVVIPSYVREVFEYQLKNIELFADTMEFLKRARETHTLLCMSNLAEMFTSCFTDFGLQEFMKPIFSCRVDCYKPQPLIYNKVLNKIGNRQKVYMIGDSYQNDYLIPRKMGIESYWLNRDHIPMKIDPNHEVSNLNDFYKKVIS